MKEKLMGVIVALDDYKSFFTQNEGILRELSQKFKRIFVINVINLKIGKKVSNIINQDCLPENFICKKFDTSKEFLKFFKNIDLVAIQFLGKNLKYFRIHYLLKKSNTKNIMIMNLGNFGNRQTIEWNIKHLFSAYKHYYEKGFYYLFRILTILNIFPKIDLLFECNKETINAHNSGISRKFENFFPFFKISYFRKIEKVNSIFFDHFIENKEKFIKGNNNTILYIDTPLNHGDRVSREGNIKKEIMEKYYKNLNNFLKKLSKLLDMKVVVCLHPKNRSIKSFFEDFTISNEPTINMIPSSEIIVFSLSSAVLNAVMYKKRIINVKSNFLGDYLSKINSKYAKALELLSHDIDKEFLLSKEDSLKKMDSSILKYDNFINNRLQSDGTEISRIKIVKKIKENFF